MSMHDPQFYENWSEEDTNELGDIVMKASAIGIECPNCDNTGMAPEYDTRYQEWYPVQCEFCHTEQYSIFNLTNITTGHLYVSEDK
jgi:hypothetical protein